MRLVAWESTGAARPTRHVFESLADLRVGVARFRAPVLVDLELEGGARLGPNEAAETLRRFHHSAGCVLTTGRLIHHLSPLEVHDADGLLPLDECRSGLPCPIYRLPQGLVGPGPAPVTSRGPDAAASLARIVASFPKEMRKSRLDAIPEVGGRARHLLAKHGFGTIGALRGTRDQTCLGWRNFGGKTLACLKQALVAFRDGRDDLSTRPGRSAGDDAPLDQPLLTYIEAQVDRVGGRRAWVARTRLFCESAPPTLREVAEELGVTRERVRQLGVSILEQIDPLKRLPTLIDTRLEQLRKDREEPLRLAHLASIDTWFSGVQDQPGRFANTLRSLRCRHASIQWEADPPFVGLADACGLDALRDAFVEAVQASSPADADIATTVRRWLAERGAGELSAPFLKHLGPHVKLERGIVFRPRRVDWTTWVLEQAEGPLHIDEIRQRLLNAGIEGSVVAVRTAVSAAGALYTAPSTYLLPSKLTHWTPRQEALTRSIEPRMSATPGRQWSSGEIRQVLRDDGLAWACEMPLHAVEYLLGLDADTFRRLGRRAWCLARAGAAGRLPLRDVCAQVLEQAGSPLSATVLGERARQLRAGFNTQLAVRWPVVYVDDGMIGLGPRDLRLPEDAFQAMCAEIIAQFRHVERIGAPGLRRLLERHGPPDVHIAPHLLARALRFSSNVLLDGPGLGTGLRRREVEREGADFKALSAAGAAPARKRRPKRLPRAKPRPRPAVRPEPGPVAKRHTKPVPPTKHVRPTLSSVLAGLPPGQHLEQIAAALAARGLHCPSNALLEMRLRRVGWVSSGNRWSPRRR